MKVCKKISLGVIIIVFMFFIGINTSSASLIAYFPFDGNAKDATGNGHDGTVYGALLTSDGYKGSAYQFDGIDDYIYVPLNINPSTMRSLTMGAWVKASNDSPIRQVISHDNGGYDRSLGIDQRGGSTGWSAFSGSGEVLGGFPVTTEQWTFVAVVYDESSKNVMLYVDGQTMSETGDLSNGKDFLRIGSNPGFGEYFQGTIDEVFFFDEALTKSQLDNIMNNGVSSVPIPPSLVLLFSTLLGIEVFRRVKLLA